MRTGNDPFAGELRALRRRAGLSLRQVAVRAGYSVTALSNAETGRRAASWAVAEAFIQACGEDSDPWKALWTSNSVGPSGKALPAQGFHPAVDGADPVECGCDDDKITAGSRHLIWTDHLWGGYRNVHLGIVQLRYSHRRHAAWGRFVGSDAFDHLAGQRRMELSIEIHRQDDGVSQTFLSRYCLDWHWSDVLLTNGAILYARAAVFQGGNQIGASSTQPVLLY